MAEKSIRIRSSNNEDIKVDTLTSVLSTITMSFKLDWYEH